jgi:hypothetical protein
MKNGWVFRNNELSLKEFYRLNKIERKEYISFIENLSTDERSSCDNIILNLNGINTNKVKEFLSLDND